MDAKKAWALHALVALCYIQKKYIVKESVLSFRITNHTPSPNSHICVTKLLLVEDVTRFIESLNVKIEQKERELIDFYYFQTDRPFLGQGYLSIVVDLCVKIFCIENLLVLQRKSKAVQQQKNCKEKKFAIWHWKKTKTLALFDVQKSLSVYFKC